MTQQEFRMLGLLLVPYAVVALSALGSAGSSDLGLGGEAQASAPYTSNSSDHYRRCQEQHRLDAAEPPREQRAAQHRQDPNARSQSPLWARQAQANMASCLRGGL